MLRHMPIMLRFFVQENIRQERGREQKREQILDDSIDKKLAYVHTGHDLYLICDYGRINTADLKELLIHAYKSMSKC